LNFEVRRIVICGEKCIAVKAQKRAAIRDESSAADVFVELKPWFG
jgi:hypothetical protein